MKRSLARELDEVLRLVAHRESETPFSLIGDENVHAVEIPSGKTVFKVNKKILPEGVLALEKIKGEESYRIVARKSVLPEVKRFFLEKEMVDRLLKPVEKGKLVYNVELLTPKEYLLKWKLSKEELKNLQKGFKHAQTLFNKSKERFLLERRPGGVLTGRFYERVLKGKRKTLVLKAHGVKTVYDPKRDLLVQVIANPSDLPKGVYRIEKIQGLRKYVIVAEEKLHELIRLIFSKKNLKGKNYEVKLLTPEEQAKRKLKFFNSGNA